MEFESIIQEKAEIAVFDALARRGGRLALPLVKLELDRHVVVKDECPFFR